jgi:hypothetical protein
MMLCVECIMVVPMGRIVECGSRLDDAFVNAVFNSCAQYFWMMPHTPYIYTCLGTSTHSYCYITGVA